MPIDPVEKLETSLVIVREPDSPAEISPQDLAALVKDPVVEQSVGGSVTILRISSLREQVEIAIDPTRVVFIDQSDDEPARARFPEIIGQTLTHLTSRGMTMRAYGWNYKIAFDNPRDEPAARTILDRFVNTTLIGDAAGVSLENASLKFSYPDGSVTCKLNLEPRQNDVTSHKFWAHLNLHFPDIMDTNIQVIRSVLWEKYETFKELLNRLLGAT